MVYKFKNNEFISHVIIFGWKFIDIIILNNNNVIKIVINMFFLLIILFI